MSAAPNNLAVLRERAGLTQRKLGDRMEVHWVTISKLERGQMQLTETWLKRFALVLGCKPCDILKDNGISERAYVQTAAACVRALRKNVFGMTQAQFAVVSGVEQASVSRWENGEGAPSLINLAKLLASAERSGIAFDLQWLSSPAPRTVALGIPSGSEMQFASTARRYVSDVISQTGQSATAIAKLSGIATTTLTRFLNDPDHRYTLSLASIQKICAATGIPFKLAPRAMAVPA